MANIYSAAVSLQNVRPNVPQRPLIVVMGVAGFGLALCSADAAGDVRGVPVPDRVGIRAVVRRVRSPRHFAVARPLRRGRESRPAGVDPGGAHRCRGWSGSSRTSGACPPGPSGGSTEHAARSARLLAVGRSRCRGSTLGASIPGFVAAFVLTLAVRCAPAAIVVEPARRGFGGGATTTRTTAGSVGRVGQGQVGSAGTSTDPHCFMRARALPTCAATSPASTTTIASDAASPIGPSRWSPRGRSPPTTGGRTRTGLASGLVGGEADEVSDVARLHRPQPSGPAGTVRTAAGSASRPLDALGPNDHRSKESPVPTFSYSTDPPADG